MKTKAKIWMNTLIGAVLSLLGFGTFSCGMYACPYADLTIDGAAMDDHGKPLPEIQIVHRSGWKDGSGHTSWHEYADTLYTNSEGQYHAYKQGDFPMECHMLIAHDLTGKYESDSVYSRVTYAGGHGWYKGKAYITSVFILKEK